MPTGPTSRYRQLAPLGVRHRTRGRTLSLPIRRDESSYAAPDGGRTHRFTSFDAHDLLARRLYGREDLFWILLDANGRRLPDEFEPGESIALAAPESATRVSREPR